MLGLVILAVVVAIQPPPTIRVDSLVSEGRATFVRGDTLEIEGRGARKATPKKVYLILPDTVYRLVQGKRTPVSPVEATVVRTTMKDLRAFFSFARRKAELR